MALYDNTNLVFTLSLQPCPEGSVSYRELQCSRFDNKRINNRLWKWNPRYSQGEAL